MTAPLLRTHAKSTCVGVAFNRLAAALTGLSTGPPGYAVMGLKIVCQKIRPKNIGQVVEQTLSYYTLR